MASDADETRANRSAKAQSSGPATADLVVVGLGAMGSATVLAATRLGLDVVGIDAHAPPHRLGSTHAETRITRLAVGEGPQYLPFVARTHERWRELEAETGAELLHQCGGLIVTEPVRHGRRWVDFAAVTAEIAAGAGIDHELLDPAEAASRHPRYRFPDGGLVCHEPTAGLVMAERAVEVQLALARRVGARLWLDTPVTQIRPRPGHVEIRYLDAGRAEQVTRAERVVLATGPWLPELAAPVDAEELTVTRQVVYWFEVDRPEAFATDRLPFLMWVGETDEDYVGVFPIPPGGTPALKVLGEQFVETTTAATVDRTVSADEVAAFHRLVAAKVDGILPTCIRAEVCLYTNTPDDHFLIDTDPRSERVTIVSPCSGHGFKHSAALGEAIAETIATGRSALDLSPFRRR